MNRGMMPKRPRSREYSIKPMTPSTITGTIKRNLALIEEWVRAESLARSDFQNLPEFGRLSEIKAMVLSGQKIPIENLRRMLRPQQHSGKCTASACQRTEFAILKADYEKQKNYLSRGFYATTSMLSLFFSSR